MPYFFQDDLSQDSFELSSEESKHVLKSMRLKVGSFIWITDGKGTLAKAVIANICKTDCVVEIVERNFLNYRMRKNFHLVVAPTKNQHRIEWLVEKIVEIGVTQLTFIICDRSERKHVDLHRLHRIAIAALKQSQGIWLPKIKIMPFQTFLEESKNLNASKWIAACDDKTEPIEIATIKFQQEDTIFLIGPEGDFTSQELIIAKKSGFQQVTLGSKILRTETAALFATCCFAVNKG